MRHDAAANLRTMDNASKRGDVWTQKELNTLFDCFDEGASLEEIAYKLNRTYSGVSSMHSLGRREASKSIRNNKPAKVEKGYTSLEDMGF